MVLFRALSSSVTCSLLILSPAKAVNQVDLAARQKESVPFDQVWKAGPGPAGVGPGAALAGCASAPATSADDSAGGRVEDQRLEVRPGVEVEQAASGVQAARGRVERAGDGLAVQPVLLDELHH